MDEAIKMAKRAVNLKYENLSEFEAQRAKQSIMDCIGVMIAGTTLGARTKDITDLMIKKGGLEEASVVGYDKKLPLGAAAVVNGGLAHTLDYDDAVDASGIHATASAFPAALACCEYKGATGKELVEAVVAGADMVCRLGLTSPKSIAEMGWLGPSLCQPKEARYTPQVSSDARFSIPFTVANALVHGNVTLANFTEEGMHDEAVLKMAEKIEWYPDDELMAESKGVESAKVTITLNDGKEHYIKVEEPLGGVVNPMTEQDLINKFRDCCSHARKPMTEEQVNQLIDMCLNLEKLNDVRDLVALIS